MTERRAVARQRTFLRGVLSFNNGNSSEDGLVRNLTAEGALLELPDPRAPERFDLLVPARNLRFHAHAVWRKGSHVGVAFEGAAHSAAPQRRAVDDNRY